MRSHAPAIATIAAMALICVYSGLSIERILLANAPPAPPAFSLGTAYRDVTYCNRQALDLYVPRGASAPPLAIFVHGGGLTSGDKNYLSRTFLDELASAGFAVASLNYRLAPHDRFPAQIEDVRCGIRWLREHAPGYGVDAAQIFAFGTSYGGTLVALAALSGDGSSSIVAAVDMFGPADLPGWISSRGFHEAFGDDRAKLKLASPTNYVRPDAPPILIVQGMSDTTVPESQSVELYRKLSAAGDETELILVRNMGHMFAQVGLQPIDPSLTQIGADMVGWFERFRARS